MKRGLQYILVLLLGVLVQCVNPAVSYAAQTSTQANKSYYQKDHKVPHSELKLVESPVHGVASQQVHKLSNPVFTQSSEQGEYAALSINLLKNAYTTLLVRDYLFFIYPSHHFW